MTNMTAYVVDRIDTGSTFAAADNGDNIYIPANLAKRYNLNVADRVTMKVVPQSNEGTPYRAIVIRSVDRGADDVEDAAEGELTTEDLGQQLRKRLTFYGPATAGMLAQTDPDVPKALLERTLEALHQEGRVAVLDVFDRADDDEPTVRFYAASSDAFKQLAKL